MATLNLMINANDSMARRIANAKIVKFVTTYQQKCED